MNQLDVVGRYFFAFALAASGIQQLWLGEFVRLVPRLPSWVPWPVFWAEAMGVLLVLLGAALAWGRRVRPAALILGGLLLSSFCLQRVPEILARPAVGFVWTNPCKVLALWAGTLVLAGGSRPAGRPTGDRPAGWQRWLEVAPGPVLVGVFLVVCGVQHFVYADFVRDMVPPWIPPGGGFWAALTGVALIAGGTGLWFRPTRRWAGALSGLMLVLWVLLLHVPRAWAHPQDAGETSAVFEALALSGVSWLLAGRTSDGVRWSRGPCVSCDTK